MLKGFCCTLFLLLLFSCNYKMPEIIYGQLTVHSITERGFTISWETNYNEEEVIYECYILDSDIDYYQILGSYVATINSNLPFNYSVLRERYSSIVKIYRTDFKYLIVDDLTEDTAYFIALFKWNPGNNTIMRYELIETRTESRFRGQ